MTPGLVSKRVVIDRLVWIERMLAEIRALPLEDKQAFFFGFAQLMVGRVVCQESVRSFV